jgi:hypothetical protein
VPLGAIASDETRTVSITEATEHKIEMRWKKPEKKHKENMINRKLRVSIVLEAPP